MSPPLCHLSLATPTHRLKPHETSETEPSHPTAHSDKIYRSPSVEPAEPAKVLPPKGPFKRRALIVWDPRALVINEKQVQCRLCMASVNPTKPKRSTISLATGKNEFYYLRGWLIHCGTLNHQKLEDEAISKGLLPPKRYLPARLPACNSLELLKELQKRHCVSKWYCLEDRCT